MNQQHVTAYLKLIQELLDCPSGEEWILLRRHEDLVNPELVYIMEQVATQLASSNRSEEAKFLHNLAGQLHHILSAESRQRQENEKAAAYLALIEALLECPHGGEQQLLAEHQELIGPGLVKMMNDVAAELAVKGNAETADYLRQWATELSRVWLEAQGIESRNGSRRRSPQTKPGEISQQADTETPMAPRPNGRSMMAECTDLVDPWNDGPGAAPDIVADPTPLPQPVERSPEDADFTQPPPPLPARQNLLRDDALEQRLAELTAAVIRLGDMLAQQQQPPHPLSHLEALEKAAVSQWLLSTEEVESLIGVKPHCDAGATIFERGCWVFEKVGRLGNQVAWKVRKEAAA